MEDQVPFKVYTFWNDNEKPEVRRFGVERSVVTSYHYLNAKLQNVFPGLKHKNYKVSWKDEEGDDVAISSDDEIMIALSTMEDLDLVKLYINCKEKVTNDDDESDIAITAVVADNPADNSMTHCGVICDGCESPVVGFRYKCTSCDDYDLCARCEGAGLHPEHCMVRVPMPNMPRTVIRAAIKRSRSFLKTVTSAIEKEHCKKQRCERSRERKRRGESGHGTPHSHRHNSNCENHHRRTHISWLDIFANYMNEFTNLAGDVNIDIEKKQTEEQAKDNKSQAPKDKASTSTANEQPQCPFTVENLDIENLKKTWNMYLGGLNTPKSSTTSDNDSKNQPQESSAKVDPTGTEVDKESVKSEVSSTNTSESQKEGTPEIEKGDKADDWTVINNEKDLIDMDVKSGSSQPPIGFNLSEEFQERVKISEGQNLYPPLNMATAALNLKELERPADRPQPSAAQAQSSAEKQSPSAPIPEKEKATPKSQPRKPHPLAHIDAAIEQMMVMGFTNDGGWLTQLLESNDGNIAAVLDLLTPVNPK